MIPVVDIISAGILLAVGAAVGLAVQSLAIRYGTITSQSADAMLIVLSINVLVLVPVAFAIGDPIDQVTVQALAAFTAAGLVGTMAGRAMHFEGIKRVGSSRAEPIKSSQPLHASIIAVVVLGEVVTAGHGLALVAIVVGIAIITYEHARTDADDGSAATAGLVFPFAAAFFYGIEPTFAKLGFAEGTGVLPGLAVKTVAAILGFILYLGWKRGLPRIRDIERRELPWLVAAGAANTGFLLAYYGALTLEPVSVVVPLVQSSPLLVILISVLFVSDELERISWRLMVGAAVAVAGAVVVTLVG